MPPIATTPIAISTPVRIRFFNFDLGVLLISILLYNFTRAVAKLLRGQSTPRQSERIQFSTLGFSTAVPSLKSEAMPVGKWVRTRIYLSLLGDAQVLRLHFDGYDDEESVQ